MLARGSRSLWCVRSSVLLQKNATWWGSAVQCPTAVMWGQWERFGRLPPLIAGSLPLPEETENPGRSLSEELVQIPTASLNCNTKIHFILYCSPILVTRFNTEIYWVSFFKIKGQNRWEIQVTLHHHKQKVFLVKNIKFQNVNDFGELFSHLSYCGGGLVVCTSGPLSRARGLLGLAENAGPLTDVS